MPGRRRVAAGAPSAADAVPAAMAAAGDANGGAAVVCLGIVGAPRGLRGEVWIRTFTAEPAAIAAYGPLMDAGGRRRLRLRVVAVGDDRVLARVDGVGDRTQAEALKGMRLFVARDALPPPGEDEYYHADLLGLAVRFVAAADAAAAAAAPADATPAGAAATADQPPTEDAGPGAAAAPGGGRVTAVFDHGAGTVLEVALDDGGQPLLVPFSRAAVPVVDLAGGQLVVALLPGLLAGGGGSGAEAAAVGDGEPGG